MNRLLLLPIVLCAGCEIGCQVQSAVSVSSSDAVDAVNHLTYAKDPRTKICYAIVASRHAADVQSNGFTITFVPCTPEVEAQIAKQ